MRYERRDWISLAVLAAVASGLLFTDLGEPYLWQDEAQTAVISRTVLSDGLPYGTDGRNFFSQEGGAEYADDHLWRWHTWLSFYVVAAAFAVLGESAFVARLPFALFGLATVLLAYALARDLWRSRAAALASGGLLALSVPFLILSRQCRWYSMAAFFALLGVYAYRHLGATERRYSLLLFFAASALFHTHYFYVATLLGTLLIHSFWLERERFVRVVAVSAAVTLTSAPWILWFSGIRYGEAYTERLESFDVALLVASHLGSDLFLYFLSPLFLAVPVGLLVLRHWRGQGPGRGGGRGELAEAVPRPVGWMMSRESVSAVALLGLFCVITIVALAALAPGAYFRYLTPVAPFAMTLAGGLLGALAAHSRVAAALLFVAWLALSPIRDFVHEITHPFDGPIEGIVRFLDERARPGDVVAISYGDMPLKFYTSLRVIGGLTGEDLGQAAGAEWIILRRHSPGGDRGATKAALRALIVPADYLAYRLRYPDTPFENREGPRFHRYRTAPDDEPRVVVYGRTDAARARDAQRGGRREGRGQGAGAGQKGDG